MTTRLAMTILLGAAMLAAQAPKPAVVVPQSAPVLTFKQQMDVALAAEKISIDQKALESLPGFKEKMEKVQTDYAALQSLSLQLCISPNGKRYQLDHSTGVWTCREVK